MKFFSLLLLFLFANFGVFAQKIKWTSAEMTQQSTQKDSILAVDFSESAFTKLPNWIYECKKLQSIRFVSNTIQHLPAELNQLENLSKI